MSPNAQSQPNKPRKSAPRRKSRPKFEVPPEVAEAPQAAWVYRADTTGPEEPPPPAAEAGPLAPSTPVAEVPVADVPLASAISAEAAVAAVPHEPEAFPVEVPPLQPAVFPTIAWRAAASSTSSQDSGSRKNGIADTVLDPTSLMLAAIETIAHTVAASTRIMLAAASVMTAPVEVTRKILGRK